jgi:hypothetical protein
MRRGDFAGTAGRPGQYTGSQLALDMLRQLDRHIAINAGVVHVDVSRVLSTVGGAQYRLHLFVGSLFVLTASRDATRVRPITPLPP